MSAGTLFVQPKTQACRGHLPWRFGEEAEEMSHYRFSREAARADDVAVIEDASLIEVDANGNTRPGYRFVDGQTVKAHPVIIEVLLYRQEAERVWSLDEVLGVLAGPCKSGDHR